MKKTIILATIAILMSGCSALSTVQIAAQHTVSRYCAASSETRSAIRLGVENAISPNAIVVTCAADTTL